MRLNWTIISAVAAVALQAVGVVWAVQASVGDIKTDVAVIKDRQKTTSAQVDFLYQQFVDKGFNTAFGASR